MCNSTISIPKNAHRVVGNRRAVSDISVWAFLLISAVFTSCNKLVQIPQPVSTITAEKTFSTEANATAALSAIYSDMSGGGSTFQLMFANGGTMICTGLYSDELIDFTNVLSQFQNNSILSTDGTISSTFWNKAYYDIYMANALIENVAASTNLSASVKQQLTGEAYFLRAFCHFYLVNLFGDIPLITSSSWANLNTLARTPVTQVYQQIITDLKNAQQLLPTDYAVAGGERTRANSWAATALLARVYLYTNQPAQAEQAASSVINSGNYSLLSDPTTVFLKNSKESIFQLQTLNGANYATVEGNKCIPASHTSSPSYVITDQLINSFEPGDARRAHWIDSTVFAGTVYHYPAKYRTKKGSSTNIPEYYTVLRLSEQYLIRAEAKAQQGSDLTGAISDIDTVRRRAGLPDLPPNLLQADVIAAVMQERKTELFCEWGHRWLDLKRTGRASAILQIAKPGWQTYDLLWPIPASELIRDYNLIQNPGY